VLRGCGAFVRSLARLPRAGSMGATLIPGRPARARTTAGGIARSEQSRPPGAPQARP
jgi:hypothetical protein